ncbi:MAG: apolipoprotein N-acyltransferase [Acidimicrobiia bacterium]|nr:apolipoprotein N-acyltransferase [Acidimicrobiia bacterium]
MRSVVLGVLAGLLAVLAYPPWGWGFVAPVGIAGFLWAILDTKRPSEAWLTGWGFGIAFFGFLFPWLGELVDPAVIALGPLVLSQAAFTSIYARVLHRFDLDRPWIWWSAATGGWAAMELVRLRFPFGGFGWGLAGYPMGEYVLTRDATQFFGVTGWSVVVAGLAAGAVVWIRTEERRPIWAIVSVTVVAVVAGAISPAVSDGEAVRVAIVQGSTPCPQQRCAGERTATYRTSLELTRSIEPGTVDLVVWPEGSTGFSVDPVLDPQIAAEMGAEAERIGAVLLAGADRPQSDTEWTNANVVFDTSGEIVGEYPKRHPVPFGEYVPFRPLFAWIPDLSRVPRDMIRGSDPVVFDGAFGPFGSVISFESAFSRYARHTVNEGADLLIVATSQASYPFSVASDQLIAMTRMRSAELGVDVVHSAITGKSTLITDGGEVGETTDLVAAEVLIGTVEMRSSGGTVYAVLGDWLALLAAFGLGGTALYRLRFH